MMRASWIGLAFGLLSGAPALAATGGLAGRARELVSAWVDAQGRGDRGAYAKLYHREFSTLRGSPPTRVNRERWLVERRALLGARVRVERLHLQPASREMRVYLTERRGAGNQEVRTRKLLVIALEGKALRIRDERQLAVLPPPAKQLEQAALVLGRRVVLSSEPQDAWASGKPSA